MINLTHFLRTNHVLLVIVMLGYSCKDNSNIPPKEDEKEEVTTTVVPTVKIDSSKQYYSQPIPQIQSTEELLKFSKEECFVYDQNGEGFHGYFELIVDQLNRSKLDKLEPAKIIGSQTWTFCKMSTEFEIARVEEQVGEMLHRKEFLLRDNELVHVNEKEIRIGGAGNVTFWDCHYTLLDDEVIEYRYHAADTSRTISENWYKSVLKTWKSYKQNFFAVKEHLGFDGTIDQAALDIQTGYLMGENDGYYAQFLNSDIPVKIVISHYLEPDQYWQDSVLCNSPEETVRYFTSDENQRRNRAWLITTKDNHAQFKYLSKKKRFYLTDLYFTEDLILKEVRIIDKQWKGRWSELTE